MPRRCSGRSSSAMISSCTGWPNASAAVQPKVSSACAFQPTTRPWESIDTTASMAVSITARRRDSERASASAMRRRVTAVPSETATISAARTAAGEIEPGAEP